MGDWLTIAGSLVLAGVIWNLAPPSGWWPVDFEPGTGLRQRMVRAWRACRGGQ